MPKLIALLMCAAVLASAQSRDYVVVRTVSLSNAAEAVTVQAPASSAAKVVRFIGAYVYCSAPCNVTLERDGTAATTTAATPAPVNSTVPAARTGGFVASNAGTGTVLGDYAIPAEGAQALNLSGLALYGSGTGKNVTIRVAAMTGTFKTLIQFQEEW